MTRGACGPPSCASGGQPTTHEPADTARPAVAAERGEDDALRRHLLDATGEGVGDAPRTAPEAALAFYAGLFAPLPRGAVALEQLLGEVFGVPAWMAIGNHDNEIIAAPKVPLMQLWALLADGLLELMSWFMPANKSSSDSAAPVSSASGTQKL